MGPTFWCSILRLRGTHIGCHGVVFLWLKCTTGSTKDPSSVNLYQQHSTITRIQRTQQRDKEQYSRHLWLITHQTSLLLIKTGGFKTLAIVSTLTATCTRSHSDGFFIANVCNHFKGHQTNYCLPRGTTACWCGSTIVCQHISDKLLDGSCCLVGYMPPAMQPVVQTPVFSHIGKCHNHTAHYTCGCHINQVISQALHLTI